MEGYPKKFHMAAMKQPNIFATEISQLDSLR